MAIHTLFSTRIYQAPLAFASANKSGGRAASSASKAAGRAASSLRKAIERDARIIREIDEDGQAWSRSNYKGGFTTYGSMDSLHSQFPPFAELEKFLDKHVVRFSKLQNWNLGGGRLRMVTCWVNIMPAGAAHSLHLHPLAVVSGTFYVTTPPGTSPIKFEDPRLERFMAQPPRHPNAPVQDQPFFELKPKAGEVVLFESWLRHEVPTVPLDSKHERISVSFNYDWV